MKFANALATGQIAGVKADAAHDRAPREPAARWRISRGTSPPPEIVAAIEQEGGGEQPSAATCWPAVDRRVAGFPEEVT